MFEAAFSPVVRESDSCCFCDKAIGAWQGEIRMNMQGFLGSEFLDLGVGMALLFLFVSLICTALREIIEGILKYRAENLHHALQEILNDTDFDGLVKQIYTHPSVYALYFGEYPRTKTALWWRNLPSYIPAANFSAALLDIIVRGDPDAPAPAAPGPPPAEHTAITIADVQAALANMTNAKLKRALLVAFDFAKDDLATARASLEAWYNAAMDRVSGAYKRQTQQILFGVGFLAAMLLNIDAITIVERLSQNRALRDTVVAAAQPGETLSAAVAKPLLAANSSAAAGPGTPPATGPAPAPPPAVLAANAAVGANTTLGLRRSMERVGLPVGWDEWFQPSPPAAKPDQVRALAKPASPSPRQAGWFPTPQSRIVRCAELPTRPLNCGRDDDLYYYVSPEGAVLMVLGWLITAFAITLGAPFWFDVLNKFMVVRSTVKPHEKSVEEASKDARPPVPASPPAPPAPAAPPAAPAAAAGPPAPS
jgi:hypothetical protein